jgi:hypothetical protein
MKVSFTETITLTECVTSGRPFAEAFYLVTSDLCQGIIPDDGLPSQTRAYNIVGSNDIITDLKIRKHT